MTDETRRLLHDAAGTPAGPVPFERLWARGRRRRRLARTGVGAGAAATVLAALLVVGPLLVDEGGVTFDLADDPGAACPVTEPGANPFVPPDPYPAEPLGEGHAWYGTADLWTVLTPTGREIKSVWWSVHFGGGHVEERPDIEVVYERLDDPDADPVVLASPATNAHEPSSGWFMIAGMRPTDPGCWRATATYRDAELSYVYFVAEDESADEADAHDADGDGVGDGDGAGDGDRDGDGDGAGDGDDAGDGDGDGAHVGAAVECDGPETEIGHITPAGEGTRGAPETVVGEWLEGRLTGADRLAELPEARRGGEAAVAVVRDGRTVAIVRIASADGGGWHVMAYEGCPGEILFP